MKRIALACFAGGAVLGWSLALAFLGRDHPRTITVGSPSFRALTQPAIVSKGSQSTSPSPQELLEATLSAREESDALCLFRKLLIASSPVDANTLRRALTRFRGRPNLVAHASFLLIEELGSSLCRDVLEQGELELPERVILLRALAESGDPAARAYLLRRISSTQDEEELGVMLSAIKSDASILGSLSHVIADPAATSLARRRISETLREAAGDPEIRNSIKLAALSAQDPTTVLLLANALSETGEVGILKEGLERIALDPGRPAAERISAINCLSGIPGPDLAATLQVVASNDLSTEVRSLATAELLRRDCPVTGLLAVHVAPGSQAEGVGLQRGDVLLSYDGQPYTVESKLREAALQIPSERQVPVVIYRAGEILQVSVQGGRIGISTQYVAPH